ncbi:MAG: oxygen-binding di-iron domain-containing protein [Planctomycetota bacterium]|jgi:flavorubredoxin
MDAFSAVKITDRVYWVGAIDWSIRNFHGYLTSRGTTYNAYLVMADKITLVDTVKRPFKDEMLARVASVVEPSRIDYIVSHHSEMDHSGSLPDVIEAVGPEKVFASTNGVKALRDHFHLDREIVAVKDGEKLSLGDVELTFLETKMLHWPDSMISYLARSSSSARTASGCTWRRRSGSTTSSTRRCSGKRRRSTTRTSSCPSRRS